MPGAMGHYQMHFLQVNLTRLKKTLAGLDMDCRLIPIRGTGYRLVPAKQEDTAQ